MTDGPGVCPTCAPYTWLTSTNGWEEYTLRLESLRAAANKLSASINVLSTVVVAVTAAARLLAAALQPETPTPTDTHVDSRLDRWLEEHDESTT